MNKKPAQKQLSLATTFIPGQRSRVNDRIMVSLLISFPLRLWRTKTTVFTRSAKPSLPNCPQFQSGCKYLNNIILTFSGLFSGLLRCYYGHIAHYAHSALKAEKYPVKILLK